MTAVRLVLAVCLLAPIAAHAQDRGSRRGPTRLPEELIHAEHTYRPAAEYVLTRGHVDHSAPEQRTSFVREIVRAAPR